MAKKTGTTTPEIEEVKSLETTSDTEETPVEIPEVQPLDTSGMVETGLLEVKQVSPPVLNPDVLTEQLKELTEADVVHRLFGGYWEQTTRALAAGNAERAAQWLEQGLGIARAYIETKHNLMLTAQELNTALNAFAQTYVAVIAELQSMAAKPVDTTWVSAYERIEFLENQIKSFVQSVATEPKDPSAELEQLHKRNAALEQRIKTLENQEQAIIEAVDTRVKAILRAQGKEVSYNAG